MQSTTSSTRTFITPTPQAEAPEPKKRRAARQLVSKKNLPWLIIVVLVIASAFLFLQYRVAQNKLSSNANTAQQVINLVTKVRKIAVLPTNETPTVATVVHADKLKSQTFFANAQDGDKVLVYNKEREAILYRPSTNQVVTIAPVSVTPTAGSNLSSQ